LTFGVFFTPLLTEFGWTRAITSSAHSLCVVIFGFLGIVAGRLSDRFGPKVVLIAGGFLIGAGYILMSQTNAIWQLYLFYGVMVGIGLSPTFVVPMSTIARWFVKRRGMVTGIVLTGSGLLKTISPPVVSLFISGYGWRISYIILGIITLVVLIGSALLMKYDPSKVGLLPYGASEEKEGSSRSGAKGFSLGQAIQTRQFWMLFVVLLCFGLYLQIILVHIVPHAIDLGVSPAIAAGILAAYGGVSTGGMLVGGGISDKIGIKLTLISVLVLALVASLCLLVAQSLWMLYLFAVIFGFAQGGLLVLAPLIVAELFGLSSHGAILASIFLAQTVGGCVGAYLAGYIFDVTNSYQLAWPICSVLTVVGLILALLLKPTRREMG
jgi:MFS family permease